MIRQTAAVFLAAYAAVLSVVLGTLAMSLIAHLTTATWFRSFRPHARRVLRSLPVLAALGVIVLVAMPVLFPWFGAGSSATDVGHYLNAPFFVVRFIIYWIAWLGIARALAATDRLAESGDVERAAARYRNVAAAGLIVLGITMTFAAFDWMMSLTPAWVSTIYGVYWFAGGMVGALALLGLLASRAETPADDLDSLGKLLLTFILFWVYCGFAQYIVIWSGGLPREVDWYVVRTRGGWAGVATLLLFAGFAFPFLLLLMRALRRSPAIIAGLGVLLLALHYLDTLWIVLPGVVAFTWWTFVLCALALGIAGAGTWVSFSTRPS
ncbi:MAG TPA: hypothetical protein VN706_13215 [Gemmatimonadaceae bacterium]|nr:hypothetical protein [Gemmatimonadaceae bacterium]